MRVKDIYFIYDALLGWDTVKRYSAAEHLALEGCTRAAAEAAEAEKKEKAIEAYMLKLTEGFNALNAELEKKIADLRVEYDVKKQKLEQQIAEDCSLT